MFTQQRPLPTSTLICERYRAIYRQAASAREWRVDEVELRESLRRCATDAERRRVCDCWRRVYAESQEEGL